MSYVSSIWHSNFKVIQDVYSLYVLKIIEFGQACKKQFKIFVVIRTFEKFKQTSTTKIKKYITIKSGVFSYYMLAMQLLLQSWMKMIKCWMECSIKIDIIPGYQYLTWSYVYMWNLVGLWFYTPLDKTWNISRQWNMISLTWMW